MIRPLNKCTRIRQGRNTGVVEAKIPVLRYANTRSAREFTQLSFSSYRSYYWQTQFSP